MNKAYVFLIALGMMVSCGPNPNQDKIYHKLEKQMEKRNLENSKMYKGIGYYLKTVDNLLTKKMDSLHAECKLTRAEFQILNSVAETPNVDRQDLLQVVKEFAGLNTSEQLIDGLIRRELIEGGNTLTLTESGKTQHQRSLAMQKVFREKSTVGISPEDYQNVIKTLDKMISNLNEL